MCHGHVDPAFLMRDAQERYREVRGYRCEPGAVFARAAVRGLQRGLGILGAAIRGLRPGIAR